MLARSPDTEETKSIGFSKNDWITLAGIVVAIAFVCLLLEDARLNAQSSIAFTPNLIGTWTVQSGENCSFDNVWKAEAPACEEFSSAAQLKILKQQGRVFAGLVGGDLRGKITGVIGEDGTFIMQGVNGNNHLFYSGKLFSAKNNLEMRAHGNEFGDWTKSVQAVHPSMASKWFTARKIN